MNLSMDSKAIEEAAARWFARRESGAWTDADQAQFDTWLNASTAHRIAFLRLDTAWNHAARMRALGAGVPPGVIPSRGSWGNTHFSGAASRGTTPTEPASSLAGVLETEDSVHTDRSKIPANADIRRHAKRRASVWAVAASMVLASMLGVYAYNTDVFRGDRYSTPIGGLDTVPLADGSQVTLNTDSRIHVALTETERRVQLDKGEAFFDVAKDVARPFVVLAGDKRVVAIGTQFAVRRDGDDVQVIVTEGRVRLENSHPGTAQPPTQLDAGAIARTAKAEVLVRQRPTPEVEQLLSWRSGHVTFRDTALANAVAEFNRYNTRKIVIEDPAIAAIRVGGNFRSNNTDGFLELLQSGFPIVVEESEEKVVLKAR